MVYPVPDLPVNLGECLQLEERSAIPRRQPRRSWPRRHVRRQASGRRRCRVPRGRDGRLMSEAGPFQHGGCPCLLAHVTSSVIVSEAFRSANHDLWVRRHWLPNALSSLPVHTLPS